MGRGGGMAIAGFWEAGQALERQPHHWIAADAADRRGAYQRSVAVVALALDEYLSALPDDVLRDQTAIAVVEAGSGLGIQSIRQELPYRNRHRQVF